MNKKSKIEEYKDANRQVYYVTKKLADSWNLLMTEIENLNSDIENLIKNKKS